jgi:hypothetical protein
VTVRLPRACRSCPCGRSAAMPVTKLPPQRCAYCLCSVLFWAVPMHERHSELAGARVQGKGDGDDEDEEFDGSGGSGSESDSGSDAEMIAEEGITAEAVTGALPRCCGLFQCPRVCLSRAGATRLWPREWTMCTVE